MSKDLIGKDLSDLEVEIKGVYEKLKELCARDDLSPCMVSNLRFSTAAMAQVVTDLGLDYEHLYDLGI